MIIKENRKQDKFTNITDRSLPKEKTISEEIFNRDPISYLALQSK